MYPPYRALIDFALTMPQAFGIQETSARIHREEKVLIGTLANTASFIIGSAIGSALAGNGTTP
jgi:hypothetical protein